MISAIVLAAGKSTRMGQQKMLMPWGQTNVISQVISTLIEARVTDIYLVTGGSQNELKDSLKKYKIHYSYNKYFDNGEMLTSLQVGLRSVGKDIEAILVVLGDQPQIEPPIIQAIIEKYKSTHSKIIVPSYQMHRGHPWLVEKTYWIEILALKPPLTLRDFLNMHAGVIDYIEVDTPSVIQDLDTPSDYLQYKQ